MSSELKPPLPKSSAAAPLPRAAMPNYRRLKPRSRRFAEAVVSGLTPTDAAIVVKPTSRSPKRLGYRMRHDPKISAAIEELEANAMESAGITTTRTWLEVRRVAYFDQRKLLDENGAPLPLSKVDDDTVAAIAGIDIEELFSGRGEERVRVGALKKYRAWNKTDALKMILQAKRELVERFEHSGPGGGPLQSVAITTDDPAEAARAYQELIKGS
jgi:phage terminase small subunit